MQWIPDQQIHIYTICFTIYYQYQHVSVIGIVIVNINYSIGWF